MRKMFFLITLIMLIESSFACDLCNCYLTITPNDHKSMIGFRYRFSSYDAAGDHTMLAKFHHGGMSSKEEYNTYEIWGRFYPIPKIQLEVAIPYRYNRSIEEGASTHTVRGLGDLIVLTHYEVFSTFPKGPDAVKQKLYLGGGVKLPTGNYKKSINGEIDPHLQTGTGSMDFMLSGLYLAKYKNSGIKAGVNYSFNNENKNEFTFANRLNLSAALFYQINAGNMIWMPSAGLNYEQAKEDLQNDMALDNTGGTMLLGTAGSDLYYKSYALNISYQVPLKQSIGNEQPENQGRFVIGLSYSFRSKNDMF